MNIVVAACKNNGIGINNKLPWMLRNDLKYFKFLTQSHGNNAIVMGKNTCFSLPRALPKRVNYVLSNTLQNPETDREKFLLNGGYGDFRIVKNINHITGAGDYFLACHIMNEINQLNKKTALLRAAESASKYVETELND